jgi:hypothetical protein
MSFYDTSQRADVRFTATDARDILNVKREGFAKTLGIIRQMCDICIKDTSRKGLDCVAFDLPTGIFGRDNYEPKTMGRELAEQLYEDGYDVTGSVLELKISWADPAIKRTKGRLNYVDDLPSGREEAASMPVPFSAEFSRQIQQKNKSRQAGKGTKKIEKRLNL